MRWKTKIKPAPQLGDLRYKLRYALWPVRLRAGFTIWLEFYYEEYEYCAFGSSCGPFDRECPGWVSVSNFQ